MKNRTKHLLDAAKEIAGNLSAPQDRRSNYVCNILEDSGKSALKLFLKLYQARPEEGYEGLGRQYFVFDGRYCGTFNGASDFDYQAADEHRIIALCLAAVISQGGL